MMYRWWPLRTAWLRCGVGQAWIADTAGRGYRATKRPGQVGRDRAVATAAPRQPGVLDLIAIILSYRRLAALDVTARRVFFSRS